MSERFSLGKAFAEDLKKQTARFYRGDPIDGLAGMLVEDFFRRYYLSKIGYRFDPKDLESYEADAAIVIFREHKSQERKEIEKEKQKAKAKRKGRG